MSRSTISAEHNRHDRLLVARLVANDAPDEEIEQARALIGDCPDCAMLAADLRLVTAALSQLPAPARPRNFRLSPEQAAQLRGSFVERLMRRLAGPGLPGLRPLAGVALSIGLALAVVGIGLPLPMGMPAGAPAPMGGIERTDNESTIGAPAAGMPSPASEGEVRATKDTAYADPTHDTVEPMSLQDAAEQPQDDMLRVGLVFAGMTTAALAFGALLLAWYARRREDPLLR